MSAPHFEHTIEAGRECGTLLLHLWQQSVCQTTILAYVDRKPLPTLSFHRESADRIKHFRQEDAEAVSDACCKAQQCTDPDPTGDVQRTTACHSDRQPFEPAQTWQEGAGDAFDRFRLK